MIFSDGSAHFHRFLDGMATGLQDTLQEAMRTHPHEGWRDLADHVRVSHHAYSWRVDFGEHHAKAMNLEYGTLDDPPVPVIRATIEHHSQEVEDYLGRLIAGALSL